MIVCANKIEIGKDVGLDVILPYVTIMVGIISISQDIKIQRLLL